jgi:hypothetical protein
MFLGLFHEFSHNLCFIFPYVLYWCKKCGAVIVNISFSMFLHCYNFCVAISSTTRLLQTKKADNMLVSMGVYQMSYLLKNRKFCKTVYDRDKLL